jgi:hypothetical protein
MIHRTTTSEPPTAVESMRPGGRLHAAWALVIALGACCPSGGSSGSPASSSKPAAPKAPPAPQVRHPRASECQSKGKNECSSCCSKCCAGALGLSRGTYDPKAGCVCLQ